MTDVLIYQTANGGDMLLQGNDVATVDGVENAPYLAMFGASDWWGNEYMDVPFESKTIAALRDNLLNSSGRIKIEAAMQADLSFLDSIPGTTWSVATSIQSNPNQLIATITINGQQFILLWNPDTLYLSYQI